MGRQMTLNGCVQAPSRVLFQKRRHRPVWHYLACKHADAKAMPVSLHYARGFDARPCCRCAYPESRAWSQANMVKAEAMLERLKAAEPVIRAIREQVLQELEEGRA